MKALQATLSATRHAVAIALLTVLAAPPLAASDSADVRVANAWVRHAPPGVPAHATYLELANDGNVPRTVLAVSSSAYEAAALHNTQVVDGIATMQHLAQLTVAPGEVARFVPGGLHLMLLRPKAPLGLGDHVPIVLRFDDGGVLAFSAVMRKAEEGNTSTGHGAGLGASGHKHGS